LLLDRTILHPGRPDIQEIERAFFAVGEALGQATSTQAADNSDRLTTRGPCLSDVTDVQLRES
jgi:hypothetical protein